MVKEYDIKFKLSLAQLKVLEDSVSNSLIDIENKIKESKDNRVNDFFKYDIETLKSIKEQIEQHERNL